MRLLALGLTAALCLGASTLYAQEMGPPSDETAEAKAQRLKADELRNEGVALAVDGKHEMACVSLRASYAINPNIVTLPPLSRCEFELKHYATAANHASVYLGRSSAATEAESMQAVLKQSRPQVAQVTLVVPPGYRNVSVDGQRVQLGLDGKVFVAPGSHQFLALRPSEGTEGSPALAKVVSGLERGKEYKVTLGAADAPPEPEPAHPKAAPASGPTPGPTPGLSAGDDAVAPATGPGMPLPTDDEAKVSPVITVVGIGVSVIGIASGIALFALSANKAGDAERLREPLPFGPAACRGNNAPVCQEIDDLLAGADGLELGATIALGGGALVAAGTLIYVLTGTGTDSSVTQSNRASIRPTVAFDTSGAVLGLSGSF